MTDDNTNQVDLLAADIRKVDGEHKLGAGMLAQALTDLGWAKHSPKDDASVDYPRQEGDFIELGPEIFTLAEGTPGAGVISWRGENFYRTPDGKPPVVLPAVNLQPPLKDYKDDERVEVFKNGAWLPGQITSRDRVSGHLHIHTERGPVTIATSNGVRKLA